MVRSSYSDKTGLKRGTWTIEEDRKLSAYIQRYGHWNWRELPKFAGLSRCGKSCRLRWMNYLRPNIKRGNYTREEDEIIISLHETLGNRWSAIAAKLQGRTDNEIKNHWHTHLKKRLQQSSKQRKEAIVQLVEVSECESESETNTSLDITSRPSILESSSVVSLSLEKTTCNSASSPNDTKSITTEILMTDGNISEEIDESTRNFSTEPFQMAETNLAENYTPKMNYTTYEIPMTRGDSSETIGECSGNFWNEPFQLEESDMAEIYMPNLMDLALIFPPSPHHSFYDGNGMEFYLNPLS